MFYIQVVTFLGPIIKMHWKSEEKKGLEVIKDEKMKNNRDKKERNKGINKNRNN